MGTTITIGIVHDNGIPTDGRTIGRLTSAMTPIIGLFELQDTLAHSVSLEREDTALLCTLTRGEHPDDTDAPDEPDELDDLSGVFQRIFDAIRSNRDAEEPSHLVDHVQRYVHDDGTVKVGERRIHSVTGNIATVTDITVERFVDADPLVVVYYTWVDRPEDGPLNGYQPYVAFQRTWAPSRKIRVATADSGLTVAVGKRYRNDREVVEVTSIDEHPDRIDVTCRQAWDLTTFDQPFVAPERTTTLNHFARCYVKVDDVEAAPPAESAAPSTPATSWSGEVSPGKFDTVRVGQRRRCRPDSPATRVATVKAIHRSGDQVAVSYDYIYDDTPTVETPLVAPIETFVDAYPTIVEPEPAAPERVTVQVGDIELAVDQLWTHPDPANLDQAAMLPVRIVGLVKRNDGRIVVHYRSAGQADHATPHSVIAPFFLVDFPVQVQP